jgi:hypothetical protein
MPLPNLCLPSRVNQTWQYSGLDSPGHAIDKKHFENYRHKITYNYNSRGFRDQEWPDNMQELRNAIWCIGDSFTVGLGSPLEHTWPFRLSKISNQRIVNVSMDGASNEWIARTAENIVREIGPAQLVIMWSYTHRREHNNVSFNDEQRRLDSSKLDSSDDDWQNFLRCKNKIDSIASSSVQFSIPFFHNLVDVDTCWNNIRDKDWPPPPKDINELNSMPGYILTEIETIHNCLNKLRQRLTLPTIYVDRLDVARDGHHFDLITADWVATQAADRLNLLINSKS